MTVVHELVVNYGVGSVCLALLQGVVLAWVWIGLMHHAELALQLCSHLHGKGWFVGPVHPALWAFAVLVAVPVYLGGAVMALAWLVVECN